MFREFLLNRSRTGFTASQKQLYIYSTNYTMNFGWLDHILAWAYWHKADSRALNYWHNADLGTRAYWRKAVCVTKTTNRTQKLGIPSTLNYNEMKYNTIQTKWSEKTPHSSRLWVSYGRLFWDVWDYIAIYRKCTVLIEPRSTSLL